MSAPDLWTWPCQTQILYGFNPPDSQEEAQNKSCWLNSNQGIQSDNLGGMSGIRIQETTLFTCCLCETVPTSLGRLIRPRMGV